MKKIVNIQNEIIDLSQYDDEYRLAEFSEKKDIPFYNNSILHERLGLSVQNSQSHENCFLLKEGENKIGVIPRLCMKDLWNKAHLGDTEYEIDKDQWDHFLKELSKNVRKSGNIKSIELLQDFWDISELELEMMFLENICEVIHIIKQAILEDIKQTKRLKDKWRKIKNYPVKIPLNTVFSESDIAKLQTLDVKTLNDLRYKDIYDLKNLFLEKEFENLPDEINAVFKEDRARKNDRRFRIVPFVFQALSLLPMIIIAFVHEYTLIKNVPMTIAIGILVDVWTVSAASTLYGIIRADHRRKTMRPEYKFFSRKLASICVLLGCFAIMGLVSVTVYYQRYDDYDSTFYYRNISGSDDIALAGLRDTSKTELRLPQYKNESKIVKIDYDCFRDSKLEKVYVPTSINEIGSNAFRNCGSLKSFEAYGVTVIGKRAFYGCKNMPSFTFGKVESIGESAFENCEACSSIKLTDTTELKIVSKKLFYNCKSLVNVNLANNAVEIKSKAFYGCKSLSKIVFGESVEKIGKRVLYNCDNLRNVTIPFFGSDAKHLKTYAYIYNKNTPVNTIYMTRYEKIQPRAFRNNKNIEVIRVSDYTKSIGKAAFQGCTALRRVVFSYSMDNVEDSTFDGCSSLQSIGKMDNIKYCGKKAFNGCYSLNFQNYNLENVTYIGEKAFKDCINLKEAELTSATSIGAEAFSGCCNISVVDLGQKINKIDNKTFYGCASLITVEGLNYVEAIGKEAFRGCICLSQVNLGDRLRKIGKKAFYDCDSVSEITIPNSVQKIEKGALENCESLRTVSTPFIGRSRRSWITGYNFVFGKNAELTTINVTDSRKIYNNTFKGGKSIANIKINEGITQIGNGAFKGLNNIVTIQLPSTVTKIEKKAFQNLTNLQEINIPSHVTELKDKSFEGCSSLVTVTGGNSVEKIGKNTFANCYLLSNFSFPEVKEVGKECFKNCFYIHDLSGLESLHKLSDGSFENSGLIEVDLACFDSVPARAFKGCDLMSISFGSGELKIGNEAFKDCNYLEKVDMLNSGVISIGKGAFASCSMLQSITLPLNIDTIPEKMAENDVQLVSVDFNNSVKNIKKKAFSGCTSLKEIVFPAQIENVGEKAFSGCTSLRNLTLPSGLKKLGRKSFEKCGYISSINVPFVGRTQTSRLTGVDYVYGEDTMIGELTITRMKNIYAGSFKNASNIRSVRLVGTQNIKNKAFYQSEVVSVTFDSELKSIGNKAFYKCTELRSILIPNTVEKLGNAAFEKCTSLKSVKLPDGLNKIGNRVFSGCGSLSDLNIPDSVITIGKNAFADCISLTEFSASDSLRSIKEGAFKGCTNLSDIDFSCASCLTEIGSKSFQRCPMNSGLIVPNSIKKIGRNAFDQCGSLTDVIVPFVGRNQKSTTTGFNYVFGKQTSVNNLTVTSMETIHGSTFKNARKLKNVTILETKKISNNAFAGCTSLNNVTLSVSLKSIGDKAFYNCKEITEINLPRGVTKIGKSAFEGCSNLTAINLPTTINKISDRMFYNCSKLKLSIPSVVSIGKQAFTGCASITDFSAGSDLKVIKAQAFKNCSALKQPDFSCANSLMEIGSKAFQGCSWHGDLLLPSTLKKIGYKAFDNCGSIDNVIMPFVGRTKKSSTTGFLYVFGNKTKVNILTVTSMETIHASSFKKASNLQNVILLGTKKIKSNAFNGCTSLLTISLDSGLQKIGNKAFYNCTELKQLDIPNSVTQIGNSAFENCSSLEVIVLPPEITSIGNRMFYNCYMLKEISIPYGVKTIGRKAFMSCASLTDFIANENLKRIKSQAFRGCSNLSQVSLNSSSLNWIGSQAFRDCVMLREITIPSSVKIMGKNMFKGCTRLNRIVLPFMGSTKLFNKKLSYFTDATSSLSEVEITNAKRLAKNAFQSYDKITRIILNDGITKIGDNAFSDCSKLKEIRLPSSLKEQYREYFEEKGVELIA